MLKCEKRATNEVTKVLSRYQNILPTKKPTPHTHTERERERESETIL
jgi:hypothetical protein